MLTHSDLEEFAAIDFDAAVGERIMAAEVATGLHDGKHWAFEGKTPASRARYALHSGPGFLFSDAEIMQNLTSEMTSPNKTERKSLDDILRNQARRLTQRVLTDQHHLEEIGREVKAIKRIVRKHAKRHR